ncbi:unnamed protein product [Macrosiphum euphorbiae]|uniref:Peptidase aspartic putative domain-containing protein n=1 Tax=Macrosiphum euphorbiae TaxID=13131 RepID=A0AAV0WNQ7_9HEMI|nr:unnamed protein product [Macrosiphum euphorbiae]
MALSTGDQERIQRTLKRNIIKRDVALDQLSILCGLVTEAKNNQDVIPDVQARATDLELYLTDLRLEQDAILENLIDLGRDSEYAVHAIIGKKAVDTYYSIKAAISVLGLNQRESSNTISMPSVHLPKISLPTFNGEIRQWCTYRDTFMSLVHNNRQISIIQKFHYLVSTVSGPAVTIVRSLPLTENNYPIVWDALIDRYNNKRELLDAHLDAIFQFNPLTKESLPELQRFLGTFTENIAAIDALDIDNVSAYLLFYIASRVLDSTTIQLFEFEHHDTELPTFEMLSEFVKIRCQVLKNSTLSSIHPGKSYDTAKKQFKHKSSFTVSTNYTAACVLCKDSHPIYQCPKFVQKNVKQRFKFARDRHLCMNCLSNSHKTSECSSIHKCKHCASKHHSLLHLGTIKSHASSSTTSSSPSTSEITPPTNNPPHDSPFVGTTNTLTNVILGTAVVRIQNNHGEWKHTRVLLDPGSQVSVITNACASRLGLKRRQCNTIVTGLSQTPGPITKGSTDCILIPHNSMGPQIPCQPVILSRISGLMPNTALPPRIRATYVNYGLADPQFDIPHQIDFLLGADIYPYILGHCSQVVHTPGMPSIYETILGWIVLGQSNTKFDSSPLSLVLSSQPSINDLIRQFWEVEEPTPLNKSFNSDKKCEDHFLRTTSRDEKGRYSIALPFKEQASTLGDSRVMAVSRFLNLERKLIKDPVVYEQYRQFMQEYESLGHMREATCPGKYHIPHHAVIKQENNKIKLRVVFDASAKSSSGVSLNDILHVGPKLQTDISDLLHRCRLHKFMFTADICKMYRQITVIPEDRQYQHIIWRPHIERPLLEYELNTITYGISSSPFQAIRVLHQLEREEGSKYPSVANTLSAQTYVDDIISGANTVESVIKHQHEVTQLLLGAGFELKKWSSNCDELLHNIPPEDRAMNITFEPKDSYSTKILGLQWDPSSDIFSYHTSTLSLTTPYTKRSILSTIAKLYDPLGLLGPIIFWAKCFMQSIWQANIQWDEQIPEVLADTWKRFSVEIPLVSQIKLRRYIDCSQTGTTQLLGFSDASKKGYAATVYLRHIHDNDQISVYLITAKSKVAPLKITNQKNEFTIPRLELCGALLLSQTLNRLKTTFSNSFTISAVHAWTDSRIVLSWLTSEQTEFKIFVTNRLAKIAELIPMCNWHFISSELNPADCVSRGLFPSEAIDHKLYWNGPPFLTLPECEWPVTFFEPILPSLLPEVKAKCPISLTTLTTNSSVNDKEWVTRFSSLTRLQRVMAYVYRFIRHTRTSCIMTGPLTLVELQNALTPIIKITQQQYFSELIKTLQKPDNNISPRSLAQLAPFLDEKMVIRVGGRLRNSQLSEESRHPILLPKTILLPIDKSP